MSAIVIDGKGHVEGKLAAAVAKQLLEGKKIVVVRCEDIVSNGDHRFNYHKYRRYLNKTTNSNPRDGPFHQRAPSEMFRKAVRGMCNYKTARGGAAFNRLNMYFMMSNMPVVTSQYWNMVYGRAQGEAAQDAEGLQTMRTLADNMARMLLDMKDGKRNAPVREQRIATSFIR